MKVSDELHKSLARYLKGPTRKAGRKKTAQSYTVIDAATDLTVSGVNREIVHWIWANASEKNQLKVNNKLNDALKDRRKNLAEQRDREIEEIKQKYKLLERESRQNVKRVKDFYKLVSQKWTSEGADHYLQTLVTRFAAERRINRSWANKVKTALGWAEKGGVYVATSKHVQGLTGIRFEPEQIRKRMGRAAL